MSSVTKNDSPLPRLAAALAGYCLLWVLAPRAVFYPYIMDALDSAIRLTDGLASIVLLVIGTAVYFAPTMAFMVVQFAIVYYFSTLGMNFRQGLGVLLGCLLAAIGIAALVVARSGVAKTLHHLPTLKQCVAVAAMDQSLLRMPMAMLVMLIAAGIGFLVSLRVTDRNLLLPVVMFAACIDLWTVGWGPVSVMMKKSPELVKAVSVPIPQAGAGAFIPKFLIGPGDFLFAGLVFAAVSRLKMNAPRTFWFVLVTMALGMLGIATGILEFFPALVLLAVGVVGANWREFKLSKQEIVSTVVAAAVLAASVPLMWALFGNRGK